ncbi:thiol-disulfide oxidoreductase DCC family protein [Lysinibacillus sp. KU-BSD001]|uniref:thiol-disulfide oxidoreductase DCC family protein n=1 Tax=Lysinibacillus sp. KU-BSD001 TaxID=3141328 RepID=UPI0036F04CC1
MRIILFDGVCNVCDASVRFILKRDGGIFHFASLQSEVGQQLVKQYHLQGIDSVVLIEHHQAYTKSTAALHIAKSLQGFWRFLYIAIVVPRPIRDRLYAFVAKNRYKWFGQKEVCMLLSKEQQARFLS